MDKIKFKQCSRCQHIKITSDFSLSKSNKDGFRSNCKICRSEESKIYAQKNSNKVKENKKKYYENNKKEISIKQKKYRQDNLEEVRADEREKYKKNKKRKRESFRKSRQKRRKIDGAFRLYESISKRIKEQLKKFGSSKNYAPTKQYLSQSVKDMWNYIKTLFSLPSNLTPDGTIWMTVNNWTVYDPKTWNDADPMTWTWQLDHIKPHSEFHYNTMNCQEFKECWSISNLRPLSAKLNNLDKNRRTTSQIQQIKNEIDIFINGRDK